MVLIIPGTRPEIINLSPTIRECESRIHPPYRPALLLRDGQDLLRRAGTPAAKIQPRYRLRAARGTDRPIAPTPVPGELKDYKNARTMICIERRF